MLLYHRIIIIFFFTFTAFAQKRLVKYELLDKRKRAERTMQTDTALTADLTYEHRKKH